ncbi:MAG: hypothetical protein ACXVH9_00245 [Halobacteriota archaeon]
MAQEKLWARQHGKCDNGDEGCFGLTLLIAATDISLLLVCLISERKRGTVLPDSPSKCE